jgi:hypothetical protein
MSDEKKEDPSVSAKKILEELDKSAAAPIEAAVSSPAPEPTTTPSDTPLPQASPGVENSAPLITDAMRRLDELLARFRGVS